MSDPKLVWLDLETTGLDPKKGSILEIGVIVTDLELNEIERRSWVLQYSRDSILTSMNDFVLNMHMSNGLLKKVWATRRLGEVVTADFLHRLDVDRAKTILGAHAWIRRATADTEAKDCYLAGSSIHFDRAWLVEHAPEIVETVSYRMVDVSTFRVAFPGLLIDQDTDVPGVFVDFFGKPAWTPTAGAVLARKTGAPIVMCINHRRPEGGYAITIRELVTSDLEDFEKAVEEDTRAMTSRIQEHISAHPTEWVWMHRRWKTRPD